MLLRNVSYPPYPPNAGRFKRGRFAMSPHHATYRRLPYFDASSISTALPNGFGLCRQRRSTVRGQTQKKPLGRPHVFRRRYWKRPRGFNAAAGVANPTRSKIRTWPARVNTYHGMTSICPSGWTQWIQRWPTVFT